MPSPRIAIVLPVRVAFGETVVQTTSQELSAEGVMVRSLQPPAPGTEVQLQLQLPGAPVLVAFTAVVRALAAGKESGFWAEFLAAAPGAGERLSALLAAHRAGPWRTPVPLGSLYPRGLLEGEPPPAAAQPAPASSDEEAKNQRTFPRHRARFVVRFENVEEFVLQYAANISAGGVFVATEFPPAMDAIVTVALELPGQEGALSTRGQVVHRVTPEQAAASGVDAGAGVQFIDADDAFRTGLDRAIDFILTQNGKAPA